MSDFDADTRDGGQEDTTEFAPKRIIICCDGTWQSSVTNTNNVPSNVTRLARYLANAGRDDSGKQWQQIVYYDAGIGTGVGALEANFQGGTGTGFVTNVIEAYNFIVLNYNPGDQVFCLGFSRGAYTARAVAGLVTDIGIIHPKDMQDFPELYRLYQAHKDSHLFRKCAAWREWVEGKCAFNVKQKGLPANWYESPSVWEKRPHGAPAESTRWVEAVGVFDTVGSLGIPSIPGIKGALVNLFTKPVPVENFGFHNVALSPYIKNAYHAMALDEHRGPFSPTLWHYPAKGVAAIPKPKGTASALRDTWKKIQDNESSTETQLDEAWENLVDAEMFEELKGAQSELLQVWFPGVHINVGGGSDDLLKAKISDFEQIALITLTWMVDQLKRHLSFEIDFAQCSTLDRFLLMKPAVEELIQNKKKDHWLMKIVNAAIAKDPKDPFNDGNKTRSKIYAADALKGWATGPIIDSFEGFFVEAGSIDRTPGQYKETTATGPVGDTNEHIHPCVKYRIDQLGSTYNPPALKGFKRQSSKDKDGVVTWSWVKNGISIPEYKISKKDSLERTCVVSKSGKDFLGHLDRDYGIDSDEAKGLDTKS